MADLGGETVSGLTLLAVPLVIVGGATVALLVVGGDYRRAGIPMVGLALVVVGYLLRLSDTLGFLPDVLTPAVDDEDAVATLLGLIALLIGGVLIVGPTAAALDAKLHWSFALFGLLLMVLLVVHVLSQLALED